VNAYLADHRGSRLSLEYAVLGLQNRGYRPEPWTPAQTLAFSRVMAWDLRSNLGEEIDRAVISATVGREMTEVLYPPFPSEHPVIVDGATVAAAPATTATVPVDPGPLLALAERAAAVDALTGGGFEGIGSNNWVVAGSRTTTGKPLLANDPHLGIQMPSIWYQVGLHCEPKGESCPFDVAGVSFAGAPGVVIGHNDRIAWGFTNIGPDTMDLYLERVNPADPNQYEVDGEWVDMEVRTETIAVAGGDPVEIEIRSTRHGPVISGTYGALDDLEASGYTPAEPTAIALRWQALQPATVWQAIVGLNRAANFQEFRAALSLFDIAPQNIVYADVDGNIGYQSTGEVPVRAAGDGRYPVPGWDSSHEWTDLVPFEELPFLYNPPEGYIVTANQPVIVPGAAPYLGADFDYGYRARRIHDLIEAAGTIDADAMSRIQLDARDLGAAEVVAVALAVASGDPQVVALQDVLRDWAQGDDAYQMGTDSPGAAAYAAVWRHLLAATFDDQLPEDHEAGGGSRWFTVVQRLLAEPANPWWDDAGTSGVEDAPAILARALAGASTELTERLGDDPSGWRWGDLHTATFRNQTFGVSGIAPIERLFNRRAEARVSGGDAIVNATGWTAPLGYEVDWLPSMRLVVDLADLSRSTLIHTTGQSGHAFHRHYADMIDRWAAGETAPMRWTRGQVQEGAEGTLRLAPGG
jgi:penicillin amidase